MPIWAIVLIIVTCFCLLGFGIWWCCLRESPCEKYNIKNTIKMTVTQAEFEVLQRKNILTGHHNISSPVKDQIVERVKNGITYLELIKVLQRNKWSPDGLPELGELTGKIPAKRLAHAACMFLKLQVKMNDKSCSLEAADFSDPIIEMKNSVYKPVLDLFYSKYTKPFAKMTREILGLSNQTIKAASGCFALVGNDESAKTKPEEFDFKSYGKFISQIRTADKSRLHKIVDLLKEADGREDPLHTLLKQGIDAILGKSATACANFLETEIKKLQNS